MSSTPRSHGRAAGGGQPVARYIVADAIAGIESLDAGSVDAVVTSPPYWARRRYTDRDDEIGVGDLASYRHRLSEVFDALSVVLAPDGVVWLNLADTAAGSGGAGGDYRPGGKRARQRRYRQGRSDLHPGQWCSVPHRVVHDLQARGWLLRSTVIWDKVRRRPESLEHVRRPGESHEYIFMLTRSRRYRFDPERLEDDGSVWRVPAPPGRHGHPAPMAQAIANRCIAASGRPGVLLDPFAGSGTSLVAAVELGWDAVGIDFDRSHLAMVTSRLADVGATVDSTFLLVDHPTS